jgi:putative DNA primase/helicase
MFIIRANIPDELTELRQWLLWRYEDRDGNRTKVPHTCQGYRASTTNPDHWSRFGFAIKMAARPGFCDGIGFVFADDPYTGIDLDHVWQSDADEGAAWAQGMLERFADTYMEESPSGSGIKLWSRARASRCGRWAIEHGAIEVYDHGRFFTVTGRSNGVRVIADHQADVEALINNLDDGRQQTHARVIADVIPKGQRHKTLISLSGSMWRRGMTSEAIEAALLVVNQRQCDPPYSPEHIRKIVGSMQRWER